MKIQPKNINQFIESDFKKYAAILCYGNDYGLISERSQQIIANSQKQNFDSSFNYIKFDFKDINSNPEVLNNELANLAFNNHHKIIHLSGGENTISKDLLSVIEDNRENIIIITANELPTNSSLRKSFETSSSLACLACYHDDKITIRNLIIKKLKEFDFKYDSKTIDYLVSILGNDHIIAINEIEKIILRFADSKRIELDKLLELENQSNAELSIDNCINYLIDNKPALALKEMENIISSENNHINIIKQLISFFQKLLIINLYLKSGVNEVEAFSKITPPIFYKNLPFYKLALRKFSNEKINDLIDKLIELETNCKTIYINPKIFIDKFIIDNFSKVS
jgi:DNA polymerase-3 subunit delta